MFSSKISSSGQSLKKDQLEFSSGWGPMSQLGPIQTPCNYMKPTHHHHHHFHWHRETWLPINQLTRHWLEFTPHTGYKAFTDCKK